MESPLSFFTFLILSFAIKAQQREEEKKMYLRGQITLRQKRFSSIFRKNDSEHPFRYVALHTLACSVGHCCDRQLQLQLL